MNGNEYANWVAQYIKQNFGQRGIKVYREVNMGKSIIGKNRRVDILIVDDSSNKALAMECKYQSVAGTVDEKIPYTINDSLSMQMSACIAYGGEGFSKGITHMLEACEIACFAEPKAGDKSVFKPSLSTSELDQMLAMKFAWWDVFTAKKTPI